MILSPYPSPPQNYENTDLSPYQKFVYALKAPESKRQYPRRLQMFLDHLQIHELTIEEKSNSFFKMIKDRGTSWLEIELIKFFTMQNQRAERGEISTETIKNYLKPVKLFCEMNGITINWKIISRGIKRGNRYSNDWQPSKAEIKKLLEYPDRRIKPIVLIMVSSGIRLEVLEYLKWKHITPVYNDKEYFWYQKLFKIIILFIVCRSLTTFRTNFLII